MHWKDLRYTNVHLQNTQYLVDPCLLQVTASVQCVSWHGNNQLEALVRCFWDTGCFGTVSQLICILVSGFRIFLLTPFDSLWSSGQVRWDGWPVKHSNNMVIQLFGGSFGTVGRWYLASPLFFHTRTLTFKCNHSVCKRASLLNGMSMYFILNYNLIIFNYKYLKVGTLT